MKNAVIYARYSSDKQNEMSIEGQIAECRKYAEENDITVIQEYTDRAFTATTDRRPSFLRMIDDSRHGNFEIILVYQLDRFARNRQDSGYYKKILAENGVKVVSAKEYISEDSSGVITEGMLEIFGEYFSAQLSEKIQRGMHQNAEKCKYNGGPVPLGYQIDSEGYFEINPLTAPVVQEIFQRIADGEKQKEVMDDLNARGVKTGIGNEFRRTSLQKMLRNERYKGVYIFGDYRKEDGMPRIISDELFEEVQEVLGAPKTGPRPSFNDYLLTGKLYCGECGEAMTGMSGTSQVGRVYKYYECSNGIRKGGDCTRKNVSKDFIEDLVIESCKEALTDEFINEAIEAIEKQNEEDIMNPDMMRLMGNIKEVESKIEKLLDQVESGVSSSRIAERLAAREEELAEYNRQKKTLESRQRKIEPEITKRFLISLRDSKCEDDIQQRKLLIRMFIDKVFIYEDRFVILLNNSQRREGSTKSEQKRIKKHFEDDSSNTNCQAVP